MLRKLSIAILLSFFFFSFCCYNVFGFANVVNNRVFSLDYRYLLSVKNSWFIEQEKDFIMFSDGEYLNVFINFGGYWGEEVDMVITNITDTSFTLKPNIDTYTIHRIIDLETLQTIDEYSYFIIEEETGYTFDYNSFFSTLDLYYTNGVLFYDGFVPNLLDMPQMTCDTSKVYSDLNLYSQYMSYSELDNLQLEMSTDGLNWSVCSSVASLHDTETNTDTYSYFTTVTSNGDYYFRFYYKDSGDYSDISSITITNIYVDIEDTTKVIKPELNSEIISNTELKLYTQWLTLEEFTGLSFFVSEVSMSNFFFECNTYETKDENGQTFYRFYKIFSKNGTFYAFFHNGQARSEINWHMTMYAMDGDNFYYEEEEEESFFGKIAEFISNLFSAFFNTLYHIVVPTEEQWNDISQEHIEIKDTLGRHIPFVGLFSEELKKAQETVEKTDFLVVEIPSYTYSSGGIEVNTGEVKTVNLSEKYEPYRAYIRGGLFLIVCGLAFVYIVKYVLNTGVTQVVTDFGKEVKR